MRSPGAVVGQSGPIHVPGAVASPPSRPGAPHPARRSRAPTPGTRARRAPNPPIADTHPKGPGRAAPTRSGAGAPTGRVARPGKRCGRLSTAPRRATVHCPQAGDCPQPCRFGAVPLPKRESPTSHTPLIKGRFLATRRHGSSRPVGLWIPRHPSRVGSWAMDHPAPLSPAVGSIRQGCGQPGALSPAVGYPPGWGPRNRIRRVRRAPLGLGRGRPPCRVRAWGPNGRPRCRVRAWGPTG
jgi:hypothetical protein